MSSIVLPPRNLPAFDEDGAVMVAAGKHARNAVLSVFEMKGGARGLFDWTNKSAQNEADYYTKIFPKTIQKEVEVSDKRGIEDVLSAIDAEFTVVDNPLPTVSSVAANFSSAPVRDMFDAGIVIGSLDDDDETVE